MAFPESPDGTRLNAEGKRLVAASKRLGLRVARYRAEAARVAEGKLLTPYAAPGLMGWFVERLALESKVQSSKWRLEELQKTLSALSSA